MRLLHPDFKLNGHAFQSIEELKDFAVDIINKGEAFEKSIANFILEWLNDNDFINVQTSGSTGKSKKIELLKEYVFNSALATATYFNLHKNTSALLCLSAEYIAGKMMLVRAMTQGWNLFTVPPGKEPLSEFDKEFDFTAMVPYQVHHSLTDLKKVKQLIVGGGVVSKTLEAELQNASTQVFATYGMTETISHIAVRPLNGTERSSVYSALPKVNFSVDERECLQITASEINPTLLTTNDMVELLSPTSFRFLGRIDNIINTGGVKVNPESVEEKLSKSIDLPFFVASEKDETLGEKVILLLEKDGDIGAKEYSEAFARLSSFECPKKIYTVSEFVYTETEKIKRQATLDKVFK